MGDSEPSAATVSAVMVSYRTGPVLFDAIAALQAQDSLAQLILVDNGNPADVLQRLRDLEAADPRILIVSGHGNVGYAAGCNLGVARATAPHLLLINPDCALAPGALAALMAAAVDLPPPWLIGGLVRDPDGQEQRACRRNLLTPQTFLVEGARLDLISKSKWSHKRLNILTPMPEHTVEIPAVSGAMFLVPKDGYLNIGGMDDGYFLHVEDLDFFWRFHRAGGKVYFSPAAVASHLKGSSAVSSAWVEWQKAKGFHRYFKKHFANRIGPLARFGLDLLVLARMAVKICLGVINRSPAARRG